MAMQEKTDYFGLGGTTLVLTSATENKSATVVQARGANGDIVAEEIVGETSAPSCTYVVKADATLTGKKLGFGDGGYAITSIAISTSAGAPPSASVSGESVPEDSSHTDCYYEVPAASVKVCHHAQILFAAFTLGGEGCHLTDASYTVSSSLTKATKDGETIAYDVSDGKVEASITIVQTGAVVPTLTAGSGWAITSPLTKSEGDAAYATWTATLTKPLTHHAAA